MMRVGRCLSVPELSLVNQLENDLLAAYGGLDSLCIVDEEGSSSVSECHDVMLTATDLRRDDILDGDDDDIVLAPQFSPSSAPHQDEPVRDAAPTRAEDWSSNSFGLALPFLPPPSAMLEPSPTSPDEPALQKPRKSSVFDLSIGVVDASNPLAFTSVQPPSLLPPRTPSRRPHVHPPRTPSRHRPMSFLLSTGGSVGTPAVSASPSPAGPTLNISTEGPQDASPSRTYSRLLFCMDGMPPTVDTSTPTLVSPPTSSSHSPFVFNISPIARTGASLLPTHTALNFSNVSSVAMSPP